MLPMPTMPNRTGVMTLRMHGSAPLGQLRIWSGRSFAFADFGTWGFSWARPLIGSRPFTMSGSFVTRMKGVARLLAAALMSLGCLARPAFGAQSPLKPASPPQLRRGGFELSESDRAWWAFQPIRPATPPRLHKNAPSTSPIDAFIRSALEAQGLSRNPPASRRQQARRAYFDVIGLPPTPDQVTAFERDGSSDAWERLVDSLLDSPHYGERWGRHWLDLVRFAESNGYERDGAKPYAWRYRDYVIRSLNDDKPYDQFIREQIAGDEIADEWLALGRPADQAWKDALVATGIYRLHVWDDEPDSTLAAEYDDLDDVLVTTSTAFLGVTLGCARCHDHKYDPFSQSDYYSFLAFFRNIDPYGQQHTGGGGRGTGKITRPLTTPAEVARWDQDKATRVGDLEKKLAAAATQDKKAIEEALQKAKDAAPPYDFALTVVDNSGAKKPTHVLIRGRFDAPGQEVQPAFPSVFNAAAAAIPSVDAQASSSGRRRPLAAWLASPRNPLTARVVANRVWQHYFGVGLVPTPDDFGRTGEAPTNPELLDYLAGRLISQGWRLKALHREILLSETYRQSTQATQRKALERDEANHLLWRQNLRRVESEVVRDSFLAISGQLNAKAGGPSVFPSLPKEVHGTQDSAGKGWGESPESEQNRRSVYLFVKRALKLPLLEVFDFANCSSPMGMRSTTTIAPQALMALNDDFSQRQAAAFADRVRREGGASEPGQIRRAFALCVQRDPTSAELRRAIAFLHDQAARARAEVKETPETLALRSLCLSLLNLSETIYSD
ncbi:MAG: DUF1553 domain-containing protein [Verrucomicrobia bacterium]|nr:DUF1553 domain-containing protein [Verrucomicrobiota bacterium]MBI3869569.1 DUF1553 domain-containing protein [Verrucomicrobiota bacterium]